MLMRVSAIAVLTAAIALPHSLLAQSTVPVEMVQVTYSVGKVSVQPGGKGDWIKASSGLRLMAGDNLWADVNSEVEIRAGATSIMVAPETSVGFDQLSNSDINLNLRLGSMIVQMPATESSHWEIRTPNLNFTLGESGDYRLDVNAEGNETDVTANRGHGQAIADGAPYTVAAGQQVRFKTRGHLEVEVGDPDSFDVWASSRNQTGRHEHEEVADIHTDASVTEAASRRVWESNGDAGHWVYTEDYGPVWVPTHWSELVILPQPVAVVLVEPVSQQEMSVRSHGQYAVINRTPKAEENWSAATESNSVAPAQVPSQNNRGWIPPGRRNSDSMAVPSLANVHQSQASPRPTQVFLPPRMEQPRPPVPNTPATWPDKSKK